MTTCTDHAPRPMSAKAASIALLVVCALAFAGEEEQKAAAPAEPEMVLIPGGTFLMGQTGHADFSPQHEVTISPFYMDKHEVTNASYQEFCEATGRRLPEFWGMEEYRSGPGYPDHPVVGVSWIDANAYAAWRGARLPTEAEWEYAARGGLAGKNYSHGDDLDSTLYAPGGWTGDGAPSAVCSYPPNGYGLCDMTKNVLEWVNDFYGREYYAGAPELDPTGPGYGKFHVCRGGGWHTGPYCSRVYIRTALQNNWVDFNVGFRCAKYAGTSAALRMEKTIEEKGIVRALEEYWDMKKADLGEYYFAEFEFNDLGYRLVEKEMLTEAIEVFRLNTEAYPHSFNAWDSLGEAYRKRGNTRLAIENYERSLEENPLNAGGRKMLLELRGEEEEE